VKRETKGPRRLGEEAKSRGARNRAVSAGERGMSLVFRTILLSAWILGIGLVAVGLEAERIRIGHRIHDRLQERDAAVEKIRRLEVQYNRMVSPDVLEKGLPESFRGGGRVATAARGGGRS